MKSIEQNPCELEHTRCLYPFYTLSQCENASSLKSATLDYLKNELKPKIVNKRDEIADEGTSEAKKDTGGGNCFPGCTMVTTKQGTKRIDELKLFDEIQTFDSDNPLGAEKWTVFYAFAHQEKERFAEFIVLKFSNGKELTVTEDHLLFVCHGENDKLAKKAGEVTPGMCTIRISLNSVYFPFLLIFP